MCLALVMGVMIGSAVFLLPASLAPLGWNAIIGWGITITGTLCLVLVLAALARALPGGNASYSYAAAAFGPGAGFIVAWSFWISCWVSVAMLAVAVVSNLSSVFPVLIGDPRIPAIVALLVIWGFTVVNLLGVRTAGGTQVVTVLLKLVPLAGAILIAAYVIVTGSGPAPSMAGTMPVSLDGVSSAVALTLFAFVGFESALMCGDRIENPETTVPRATLIGTIATGAIYLLTCTAVTAMLPVAEVARSNAPFADFFAAFVSPLAGNLVAVFVAIAAMGALNGIVLQQGETLLPLARAGFLPARLARQNAQDTPINIHLLSGGLASLLVLANFTKGVAALFQFMALVTTTVTIIFYAAGMLAAFKLEREGRLPKSPVLIALTMFGFGFVAWAFYGAGLEASLWSLAMTAVGFPIYLFATRSRPAEQPA